MRALPLFGAICSSTAPGPRPTAPLTIVIHETLLAAVQGHPDSAATATRWVPPVAAIVVALGVMSLLQVGVGVGEGGGVGVGVGEGVGGTGSTAAASWVTVTVTPATVKYRCVRAHHCRSRQMRRLRGPRPSLPIRSESIRRC